LLKGILQEMLSYRLGTVNDFHWGFKPVLSYSKPHTFSISLGEEKERRERERENSKYKRPLPVKIITGPWQSGQC